MSALARTCLLHCDCMPDIDRQPRARSGRFPFRNTRGPLKVNALFCWDSYTSARLADRGDLVLQEFGPRTPHVLHQSHRGLPPHECLC